MVKVLFGGYRTGLPKMKLLMVATLALSFLPVPLATAQNQNDQGPALSKPGITRENETSGGKRTNPTSHSYQKGERLSLAYGSFEAVPDWDAHHLTMPAEGYHWVHYGNNYLLSRIDTGVIIDIVMASWGAGRA